MPQGKGTHLTLQDRYVIQEGLVQRWSFREIARRIGVTPSTVSREIKANRITKKVVSDYGHCSGMCANQPTCTIKALCSPCKYHDKECRRCQRRSCVERCADYSAYACPKTQTAPFVCTGCKKRYGCVYMHYFYQASHADTIAQKRLRESREGIDCAQADLEIMVSKVKKLLSQGHSLEAIWALYKDEFPVSVRTFYNYIERGVMGLANLELPKKVTYKPRKKGSPVTPRLALEGRTYSDYLALTDQARLGVVQMDCVEGGKSNGKAILTLHFPRFEFQLHLLLERKTQEKVKCALDAIELYCEGAFSDHFGILLTDRGSEFLDWSKIETGIRGQKRCHVYYCDPMKSGQKGSAEKNHVELRKILPKGRSDFDALSFADASKASSHVNSYPRASLGGATPYMLASQVLPKELLDSLGVRRVPPEEVMMSPRLLSS